MKSAKLLAIGFVLILPLFLCSFSGISGINENNYLQKEDNLGILPSISIDGDSSYDDEFEKIYEGFISGIPDGLIEYFSGADGGSAFSGIAGLDGELVSDILIFILIGLLFAVAETVSIPSADALPTVRSAVAVILALPVFSRLSGLIEYVASGITGASDMFSLAIPALTSLAAIGSFGTVAATSASGMSMSLGIISGALSRSILPVASLIFALSLVSSFDTGAISQSVGRGARSIFNILIGAFSTILLSTVGCQTLIASAKDGLALRGAKYAISGMIPVVGGAVSGALSTLISGVRLISGSIGALAVAAILYTVAAPLISLLIYRLGLLFAASICGFAGAAFGERFFLSLRGALDCLIAALCAVTCVYILEISVLVGCLRGMG